MTYFQAKLLKIDSKPDTQGVLQHRLVFESEHYDRGLDRFVPSSQAVKLHEDDHKYLNVFHTLVNKEIAVPVTMTAMDRNIYYKTMGTGYRLFKDITSETAKQ